MTFDEDAIEPVFYMRMPALVLFTEETGTTWQDAYAKAAHELKGEILFVTSGISDGHQEGLAKTLEVTQNDLPTLILADVASDDMKEIKYVWGGDIENLNTEVIKQFIADFKDKKLTPVAFKE